MVKRAGGSLLLSIRIDHAAHQPVSTQLCIALREMILTGGFAPGDRLPASRTLAKDLGLSRTTVIEVFNRLTAEGLIESQTGSGTFVSAELAVNRPSPTRLGRAWAVLVATVVLALLVGACGGMPPSGDAPPSGEGSEPSGTLLPNDPTPGRTRWVASARSAGLAAIFGVMPMASRALATLRRLPAP